MRYLLAAVSVLLCAFPAHTKDPGEIFGDYIEDRSNHVHGCYCEWSGESVYSGREAVLAWQIRSGEYNGTDLSGVRFAAVIRGDATLSIGSSPRKSVLLIDKSAGNPQRDAVEKLARRNYAALLGEVVGVHVTAIAFSREEGKATLHIPDLLDLEMRKSVLPEDALPGAIRWFDPFIPMPECTLGTTLNVRYDGREFDHRWSKSDSGTTGYFGTFSLAPR